MKKILIITAFALINLTTLSANAATTVTAYIAEKCTTTTNTSAKAICNDYTQSCSSTGMDVTTSGTYKDYNDCVLVHSYGDSTENGTYSRYVICMPSNTNGTNACKRLKELHTNTSFKGMGSGIGPSGTTFGAAGLNKTITLYMEQLNCISGCSGYTDSTPSTGVLFREPNVCTTDGTCTTHTNVYGKYLTCTIGYYSSAGLAKKTGSASATNISALSCTACPKGTYGASTGLTTSTCSGKCAKGSYTSATAQTKCSVCQNGKTTSAAGATSCDATCSASSSYVKSWATATWSTDNKVSLSCAISACKSGSFFRMSATSPGCIPCEVGTYMSSDNHGNTSCTSCPSHNSSTIVGTTASTGSDAATDCYLVANSGATWKDSNENTYDCPTTTAPYSN